MSLLSRLYLSEVALYITKNFRLKELTLVLWINQIRFLKRILKSENYW